MDKKVIFAVAGSGKTTYIINNLSLQKRSLIITYTDNNYYNLFNKIIKKFNGKWPSNVVLMTYFSFLYKFCFKPFLSDRVNAKGLIFENNPNKFLTQNNPSYYMTTNRYLYSNRLAFLLENMGIIQDVQRRLERYFDEFVIDEVQDIAGRDFNLIEHLMSSNINMLFVGDFNQHLYDSSRDGNKNCSLFDDIKKYEKRYLDKEFTIDYTTLQKSYRCSEEICKFVRNNLGINMYSHNSNSSSIELITEKSEINKILSNKKIIKLHYQNSAKFGAGHKNWGDTKGEDHYHDVCVMLNKKTAKYFTTNKLIELPKITKNKLYVAITRARGNVYFIAE